MKFFAECFNYTFLNDSTRAQTYYEDPPTNECDNKLLAGWYRFGGGAGNQMADTCVLMYNCGTHDTGWLSGKHPSVADGAVHRKVCFTYFSGCCSYTLDVLVRNCGGFYVYKLQPTHYCLARYCGNGLSFHTSKTQLFNLLNRFAYQLIAGNGTPTQERKKKARVE